LTLEMLYGITDALSVDECMQCFYQDDETVLGNLNDITRKM